MRDAMGVNGDEAHGFLARERAEPLLHARRGQAEPSAAAYLDGDQIAVLRILRGTGGDGELAPEILLVDRGEPPAAARKLAEDAEHAVPDPVDDLDGAALVADLVVAVG